jgi:predicted DNA-binding transcriptional regulator YafY
MDILKLGPDVEVQGPTPLREEVKKRVLGMARRYNQE